MFTLRLVIILLAIVALLAGDPITHAQDVPSPSVTGPVTGGTHDGPFGTAHEDLPPGYLEEERFLSGTARSYTRVGHWGIDGRWETKPADEAEYTVRMLIRRPTDHREFNGVAVVEWLNVSAQMEGAADYTHLQEELIREGYLWVGVGAQSVGVNAPRTGD